MKREPAPIVAELDLSMSPLTSAVPSLGDQNGYPDTFLDAVGTLGNKIIERGGTLVGFWPTDGCSFNKSTAIKDGRFMGLAIDTVGQDELTEERIDKLVAQIRAEFNMVVVTA
ncbi:MAG: Flavodoxin [Elusimicrobia bacterium]|nr:Flavodoxin [Elusimicrobiota bacterium]